MKVLISIIIGLLVVGCGKKQSTNTNDGNNTPVIPAKKNVEKETPSKGDDKNSTAAKPVKELTITDVVGSYFIEADGDEGESRFVFLDNGSGTLYGNAPPLRSEEP